MEDPTTIALNLTFFGTLGVAFVMFIGLFLVFVATLLIAGLGRLVGVMVMALFGRRAAGPAAETAIRAPRRTFSLKAPQSGPLKSKLRGPKEHPARTSTDRGEAPALAEDWAAAVARADARAAARVEAAAPPEVKVTVRDLPSPDAPVEDVRAVAPLVESATDQHATVKAIPRSFEKPPAPGRMAMLDTGSLVSFAGHPGDLKGTLPTDHRRAG